MSSDIIVLVIMLFVRFSFCPMFPQSKQQLPLNFLNTLHISLVLAGVTKHPWWQLILSTVAFTLTTVFAVICIWLLSVACLPQRLVTTGKHNSWQAKQFVGKPLLFPNSIDHWRYFPKVIHFKYSYFVVGIPVGLRARVGRVLSIDEDHSSGSGYAPTLWDQCWFNIDQENYLNGDTHPLGLRGKLDSYLEAEVSRVQARRSTVNSNADLRHRVLNQTYGHMPTSSALLGFCAQREILFPGGSSIQ